MTYEAVLRVDNSDLVLRPGMTATAEIVVTTVEETVLVPNAALRFEPSKFEEKSSGANKSIPLRHFAPAGWEISRTAGFEAIRR